VKFVLPLFFLFIFSCSDENGIRLDNNRYNPNQRPPQTAFDEFFENQWHLNSDKDFSVNILGAWAITKGAGVRIAVLDNNIQKYHEDFEAVNVFNIHDNSNRIEPVRKREFSHGTAVTGVISARFNGRGTIGVAPESDVIFIGDTNFFSTDANVIRALNAAKLWGARVINCSWGGGLVSESFESAMRTLYENGTVIVFATDNRGINLDDNRNKDESELEWVIGVTGSDKNGLRARNMAFGSNIDIMAPGVNILTLDLMGPDGSNNHNGLANENYGLRNGTSFAAPIVSGIAALMLSVNPSLSATEVRRIITETAQKTGNVSYDQNGFSLEHAYGLIDATGAVRRAAGLD